VAEGVPPQARLRITPEHGKEKKKSGRSFVIQKHAATRLHYDFRLEMEGVLKSWAVPKGRARPERQAPGDDDRRPPVEYGGFEGSSRRQYGGGTVLLWDADVEPIEDPHEACARAT